MRQGPSKTGRNAALALLLLFVFLSACAGGTDGAADSRAERKHEFAPYGSRDRPFRWDRSLSRTKSHTMHNNTRMEMDEQTAGAIAELDGVDRAWVLLTEKNAYVAVILEQKRGRKREGEEETDDQLNDRISAMVKKRAPRIRNVFVSADPEFAKRLRGYAVKVNNGEPIRGLILEFNRAADRLFPNRIEPGVNVERRVVR